MVSRAIWQPFEYWVICAVNRWQPEISDGDIIIPNFESLTSSISGLSWEPHRRQIQDYFHEQKCNYFARINTEYHWMSFYQWYANISLESNHICNIHHKTRIQSRHFPIDFSWQNMQSCHMPLTPLIQHFNATTILPKIWIGLTEDDRVYFTRNKLVTAMHFTVSITMHSPVPLTWSEILYFIIHWHIFQIQIKCGNMMCQYLLIIYVKRFVHSSLKQTAVHSGNVTTLIEKKALVHAYKCLHYVLALDIFRRGN